MERHRGRLWVISFFAALPCQTWKSREKKYSLWLWICDFLNLIVAVNWLYWALNWFQHNFYFQSYDIDATVDRIVWLLSIHCFVKIIHSYDQFQSFVWHRPCKYLRAPFDPFLCLSCFWVIAVQEKGMLSSIGFLKVVLVMPCNQDCYDSAANRADKSSFSSAMATPREQRGQGESTHL